MQAELLPTGSHNGAGNLQRYGQQTMITDLSIKNAIGSVTAGRKPRVELKDGGERGAGRLVLVVRLCTRRTAAEWYAQWYREGRRCLTKMGTYPGLTLSAARKLFREEYLPSIMQGRDPTGPRAWRNRQEGTVEELFLAYVESLEAAGKPSAYAARCRLLGARGAVHTLGARRWARDVKPADILPHLADIHGRGTPAEANYAHACIRAAFQFGIRSAHSYYGADRADWGLVLNPAAAIPINPDASRPGQRVLSAGEFQLFWSWLGEQDASKPVRYRLAPAIRLLMVTGQRTGEVLQLSEPHYDRRERLLEWRTTKNGQPHCLPVPRHAAEILDRLKPNEHGLFFPRLLDAGRPAAHTFGTSFIDRFTQATGGADFTLRDLRRTWKTLAGAAGLSKEIRDRLQNHALADVSTRHYDRWSYLPEKREAIRVWDGYLDKLIAGDLNPDGTPACR